ncbi:MAG TPA: C40 family peptidase [Gemmatimonadales bacterium]|jgi:cell wall-associated NlpC family hydrolase|nr:C40 family peptidase [Gemmatimonadales bacterium]
MLTHALIMIAGFSGVAAAQTTSFSATEKPFATISRMFLKSAGRDSLVQLARSQIGVSYKLGARTPGEAFDCSGLVQWLAAHFDFILPRTSSQQAHAGTAVARDTAAMLPGDLLFFGRGKQITHVGIYVGNGRYVQAANPRLGVIETPLPTGRAALLWKGVRRIFDPADADSVPRVPVDSTTRGASSS